MSLTRVTAPTFEPLTLAEVRAHCRVDHLLEDPLLAGYIISAREFAEDYTRRALLPQTWEMKINRDWPEYWSVEEKDWRQGIELPKPPFQSVVSITYVDDAGVTQTLAADQYQAVAINGESLEGLIVPANGVVWPTVRDQMHAITVRFVAGYADTNAVPIRIQQAMKLMISHWFDNRAASSETPPTEVPFGVAALLDPSRVF